MSYAKLNYIFVPLAILITQTFKDFYLQNLSVNGLLNNFIVGAEAFS